MRRITGTLHEDRCTFMIISLSTLLRMRSFSDKVVTKIKTHILCSTTFFLKSCLLWDSVEKYDSIRQATDGYLIGRMRFACWTTKARTTHSEYVKLITRTRLIVTLYVYACFVCVTTRVTVTVEVLKLSGVQL
jgi:hypothetical protein